MRYALMIYAEPGRELVVSDAERESVRAAFQTLTEDPRCVAYAQLASAETATSLRPEHGRTLVTDGPFADPKEVLGGLCVVEAADLDEALALAARIPLGSIGGTVEVRPLLPD